ncbi:MAG: hypothetical protein MHMPM18_001025 [Marteilia pararefringens]
MALALFNSGRKLLSMKNANRDEDTVSKLFGTATPVAIFILVVFISPRQYFTNPINCWQMGSFFSSYVSYAERVIATTMMTIIINLLRFQIYFQMLLFIQFGSSSRVF